MKRLCGRDRCDNEVDTLYPAPCTEKPVEKLGAIGMYHCPECGDMQIAGVPHFQWCLSCVNSFTENVKDANQKHD